jgi:hypothetical protein
MPPERSVGIKDYFEFRNIVRNTTTAGADDILTKFVGMCKILFCQDTGTPYLGGGAPCVQY